MSRFSRSLLLLVCLGFFGCTSIIDTDTQVTTTINGGSVPDGFGVALDKWPRTIRGMPLSQAPSATPSFPPTIAPPYDGDPLSATQLRVDDLTPLQNGIEAARLLLNGGGIKRRIQCAANNIMLIRGMPVIAKLAGAWTVVNLATGIVDPGTLSGGLANSTRYWVYAKIDTGPAVSIIVTTDGPDATLNYRTGDESSMWLSTFVTDGSGSIIPYVQSDLDFVYAATSDTALVSGSATVATTVSLNYIIPQQATMFSYLAKLPTTSSGRRGLVYTAGGSQVSVNTDLGYDTIERGRMHIFYSAREFQYNVTNAGSTLTVAATGFTL